MGKIPIYRVIYYIFELFLIILWLTHLKCTVTCARGIKVLKTHCSLNETGYLH